ncbi:hypothetical protein CC80DRAFT_416646 [Byssothecium circinans]|uniref:Uncharacterized protein n=1 Tax=Byssothecium circinans TaxID=147558 RepID=A0A6A5TPK0_9PLEO|nr:hypothetical protein CC80DRAFT_416646 [Byssothecium circinans]
MADTAGQHPDPNPHPPTDRQNALAQIQFASLYDGDLTPSEDESPEERTMQLETVQSAIGVSISQQQTRLTSPKTPAAEKAAALDETDGGMLFEGWEQNEQPGEQSDTEPEPSLSQGGIPSEHEKAGEAAAREGEDAAKKVNAETSPAPRLPSPWRASPKLPNIEAANHRSALRDNLNSKTRRRTMSGSSMGESIRKYVPFNFPSLPKTSSLLNFSFPSFAVSHFDHARGRPTPPAADHQKQMASLPSRSPYGVISQHDGSSSSRIARHQSISSRRSRSLSRPQHPSTAPLPQRSFSPGTDESSPDESRADIPRRPTPALRRSTSEGSLLMYRTRSLASSLGDDSRFENVSEQVNSRLKAIKDSWQDSNFKLSVPSMPNFSFGSRDDLFRSSKSGNTTPRATDVDMVRNNRVRFLANGSRNTSRASSTKPPKVKSYPPDVGMAATHPHFSSALQELEGDLVILGGYRGSVLRSAEPPHRQLWVPIKVGLNLRKVDLEIGLEPEDEERMEETIIPAGMLTHIGPVDIGKRLLKRLKASDNAQSGLLRVHNYGYDWRLSPHLLSRRLTKFLEDLPCNQPGVPPEKRGAVVIAHSLGGLITRHVINQRPELVSGVVYAGVPQHCINILGPLRNGDDVLLSSRVLTAQVNFTIRTSFALLPLDGKCFINKHTKEEYPIDFFDIKTWEEHRLSPCIAPALPVLNPNASNLSVSGLLNAMSQALPSLPGRKGSSSSGLHNNGVFDTARNVADKVTEGGAKATGFEPSMQTDPLTQSQPSPSTTVTIPHDKAVAYLTRTLAEIKQFKQELAHVPAHTDANRYPPIALIYGKSTPTVYGAKVESREAIKLTSAYDDLAFASGDGVVLAKSAMVPKGYSVVRGGVVASERGHVTLLGDLEAIGKCLGAVIKARKKGVGLGMERGNVGVEKEGKVIDGNMGETEQKFAQDVGLSGEV